jgi:hypothetical protein
MSRYRNTGRVPSPEDEMWFEEKEDLEEEKKETGWHSKILSCGCLGRRPNCFFCKIAKENRERQAILRKIAKENRKRQAILRKLEENYSSDYPGKNFRKEL